MNEKLGIPYMGSKRKLAPEILKCITQRHPNLTGFYELFGGGGSISFTAIRDYRFNGSRLGEVGDFENETLKLLLNLN